MLHIFWLGKWLLRRLLNNLTRHGGLEKYRNFTGTKERLWKINSYWHRPLVACKYCSFYGMIKLKCACLLYVLIKQPYYFWDRSCIHRAALSATCVGFIINTRLTQRVCLRGDCSKDYPLLLCFAFLFRVFLNDPAFFSSFSRLQIKWQSNYIMQLNVHHIMET